jgi:predicted  nucleic acid-binding Zn-ribbon protein
MSSQGNEELSILNRKLDELLKRYSELRTENSELRNESEKLKFALEKEKEKIVELEKKYERVKLTGALLGEDGNAVEAKRKITELVREIDRCVALLNR